MKYKIRTKAIKSPTITLIVSIQILYLCWYSLALTVRKTQC